MAHYIDEPLGGFGFLRFKDTEENEPSSLGGIVPDWLAKHLPDTTNSVRLVLAGLATTYIAANLMDEGKHQNLVKTLGWGVAIFGGLGLFSATGLEAKQEKKT